MAGVCPDDERIPTGNAFGGADMGEAMPFEGGVLSYDMYMFFHGDRMLMVMVAWGGSGPSPQDARDLADVVEAKAAAAG